MALPFLSSQAKRVDEVVGIDLGSRQTRAVHLQRKNDRVNLLACAALEAPPRDSKSTPETLAEHLRNLFKALGEGTRCAALAVGVPDAFVRHAELPPMPLADMRQMLRLNSKVYLQQEYAGHVFDCAPLLSKTPPSAGGAGKSAAASGGKQRVLVGGTKRQTLDDLKTACRSAAVVACQVTPGVLGPVNAFEKAQAEVFGKEVVALVDIGLKHTAVNILRSGDLIVNRVVAIGGEHITFSLAESMGITPKEAEGLKIGMAGEVQSNLEQAIVALGREIRASIDFFEHQEDVVVGQVYLCGASAGGEVFSKSLQAELMVPCKNWNPVQTLNLALPVAQRALLEELTPSLAVAVGTAMSAL